MAAGASGADKCIGKLTLDISNVESQIKKVQELLKSVGAGVKVDLSKNIAAEVKKQLDAVQKEIENGSKKINEAAQKAVEAINQIGSAKASDKEKALMNKLEQRYLKFENKMQAEADKTLAKMEANAQKEAAAVEKAEDRKRAAREKEEKRYQQVWDKIAYQQREDKRVADIKAEQQALSNLVNLYKQYYEMESNKIKAVNNGDIENADIYRSRAQAIWEEISAIEAENQKLAEEVGKTEEVTAAVQKWQAVANAGQMKSDSIINKQELENTKIALDELINKYTEYYNLESQKINAVHKGDTANADLYRERAKAIWEEIAAIEAANPELAKMAAESDKVTEAIQRWQATANQGNMTADKLIGLQSIADAKQKYFELTDAIKNYQAASKQGNQDEMAMWSQKISLIMQEVGAIQDAVQASNLEASVKQQILNIIQQCNTAQNQYVASQAQSVTHASELESQMTGLLTRMFSIMAVIRTISNLVNSTVEYVSEYYDKMNEIQIITQKSNAEVAQLADTYRDIAEMMNVSSLDMADAAIYFTRQGLGAAEIEERLKNVTMYAKTANVEFTEAAEIITAVVNSMGLVEQEAEDGRNAAQRVADVFLLVGDNAATSGQEIGSAMQKAAAAAGSFGVSMEWLAAYIATVSETTRQEARTIGTALNTIIARLHSIRTTGYNADDNTKVNDIAKALHTVNIELMDQYGNWRDMEDIFADVAGVWDTLTGKQKSYIATTMAGVKQQNVFLALMKDMAKGAENGSRAYELYNLAINSAGTAEEKYATYKDSIAASQERLNVAQEKFYSLLDASVIKSWNDAMAGYVNMIATGADKFGAWTIVLPVVIGLITTLAIAIRSAGTASAFFANIWETHPILVAIAAGAAVIATLITQINALASSIKTQEERFTEASNALSESNEKLSEYIKLQSSANKMFDELGDTEANKTLKDYNSTLDALSGLSTKARDAVDDLKNGLIGQEEAAEKINEELEKYIDYQREISTLALVSKYQSAPNNERMGVATELKKQGVLNDRNFGGFLSAAIYGQPIDKEYSDIDLYMLTKATELQELVDQYEKVFETIEDENERWYQIGRAVWNKYFEGAKSTSGYMEEQVMSMIDEAISNATIGMDTAHRGYIREQLMEAVFGEDGVLDETEAKKYEKVISDFLVNLYANGFKVSEEDVKQYEEKSLDELMDYIATISGEHLNDNGNMLLWEDLDLQTMQLIADMVEAGTQLSEIKDIMRDSKDVDEFVAKINNLSEEFEEAGEEIEEEGFVVKIKTITSEIDKLNKMITSLEKGETVDFEDILNFADAHPAIMAALNDAESLLAVLKEIRQEDMNTAIGTMRNNLLDSLDFANETPFDTQGQSLREYLKGIDDGTEVEQYIDRVIIGFLAQTEKLDSVGKEMIASWMNSLFDDTNMDLLDRKILDFGDHIETMMTETIVASADGSKGIKWNQDVVMNFTPITPDGKKLTDDEFYKYIEDLLAESTSLEDLKTKDKAENGGLSLFVGGETVEWKAFDEGIENAEKLAELLHLLQEAYYGVADAEKTWLELQIEQHELEEENNWAKSNGFAEQVGEIQRLLESGESNGLQLATEYFDGLNQKMKEAIADEYPGLIKALGEAEAALKDESGSADRATKAQNRLNAEIQKINRNNSAQYFDKTYEAIKKLEKGTISAADAYDVFNGEIDKVTKAQEDINDVTQKLADNTEVAENDVSNLASLLGISADQILQDFPGAVDLFNELIGETGDLRAAFDALNEAAFIRITGTSEADFSNIQDGLIATKNMAQEVIDMLVATGQWAVETVPLDGEAWVQQADGSFIKEHLQGFQQILRPTSNNPYKGTKSTGSRSNGSSNKNTGGGGSSRNNDNGMTEVERILNRMDQVHAIQEYQQSFYQSQNANFEQNGYLQGVIDASQKEIDVLTAQNQTLESNIATIEQLIAAKKKELEGTTVSSEKYEEIADDLDKLQKAHQNYSKELIENKTSIDKLNESIDEQQKKIRDMQINIRSMIYKAIEDREKKAQNMLNGEIELENKILEIIKKKYEVERDKIIENTEARISALQEERDLLSEQLELRKKMADAEDKAAKLATLEANLKRISADPTRQKEARNIRDQINDLRKEIAWDVAEEEVKAQEDSIDQQITSLEDYKQYVQEYYDNLFKHPQEMIEKMREIIMGTDEEIIDWLKKNDEDFANSSEKTQKKMIGDWTETIDKMRGTVRTYWEEVEKIIAGGDEAIIQFLMENSEDYAKAGKLEAEKYVEEWKKALDDLHKALQSAFTVEAPTYTVIDQGTGGSSSGGSSGGGGKKKEEDHGYSYIYGGKTYKDSGYASKDDAEEAMKKSVKKVVGGTAGTSAGYVGEAIRMIQDKAIKGTEKGFKVYAKGGMATQTGPAWLDGSSSEPERVLSPYQTQLFETMVKALEKIGTINIPTMPNFGDVKTGNGNNVSVGDIIVNVDNLDTDDDYEELAQKVSDVLMDKIGRTTVVGGMRINA